MNLTTPLGLVTQYSIILEIDLLFVFVKTLNKMKCNDRIQIELGSGTWYGFKNIFLMLHCNRCSAICEPKG